MSLNLPVAALLVATFIWGSTFALVKSALIEIDPVAFLSLRFAFALGTTLFVAIARDGWDAVQGLNAGEIIRGTLTGTVLFGGFYFQTLGLQFTTAANSAFITGLCVIMVPFLMWFGRRSPKRSHVAGAFLSMFGLYWLSGADLTATGWGDLLTLICALMFALHIICLGTFGKDMESFRLFTLQLVFASILAMAMGTVWGGPVRWNGNLIVVLFVTGVLATAGAFFLQTWAQGRLQPSRAAIWILTEPLFAVLFGILLLNEFLSPVGLFGGGMILSGVVVSELGHRVYSLGRPHGRTADSVSK